MDQTKISALEERVTGYLDQNNNQETVERSEVAKILEGNENKAREIENLFKIMDLTKDKFNSEFAPSWDYGTNNVREKIEYLITDITHHLQTGPIPYTLIGRSAKTDGTYILPQGQGEDVDKISLGTLDESSDLIEKMFSEKNMDKMLYSGEVAKEYIVSVSKDSYDEVKSIDPNNLKEKKEYGMTYSIIPSVAKFLDPKLGDDTPLVLLTKTDKDGSLNLYKLLNVMDDVRRYSHGRSLEEELEEFLIESSDSGWLGKYKSEDRNFKITKLYVGDENERILVKTINERTGEYEEFVGKPSELLSRDNIPEKISEVMSNLYAEHAKEMLNSLPDNIREEFKNFGTYIRSYLAVESSYLFNNRNDEPYNIRELAKEVKANFFDNQDLMNNFAMLNEIGKQLNDGKQLKIINESITVNSWLDVQPNMDVLEHIAEKINERVPSSEGIKPLIEKSTDFDTFLLNINNKSYALSMLDPQKAIKNISIADEIARRKEIIAQNSLEGQGKSIIDGIINDESEVKNNNLDL